MMLEAKYNPKIVEDKWYSFWMNNNMFRSVPDNREPYCIVIPPPNVTGVLHMGHMLNNTIQDVLVRRARMQGKNACWVPGTDHASIATEAMVVNKLKNEGIDKSSLTREEFLQHAWEWKEKHGGIILEQLKKLGASCDWERTKFTMDPDLYESVIDVFIDLHKKGLLYRGVRMVNWDTKALTALSDEEVIHKETQGKLYHIKYPVENLADSFVIIATTRPETMLGDTAVCINPGDSRFSHLKGKKVIIPLLNKTIPVIEDEYVDIEFGTGCLKITPAHDYNDYLLGVKHNLPIIDIFNDDGTLNEKAQILIGKDRFEARKEIVKMLKEKNLIAKIEDYTHNVSYSERTDDIIEPKLSMQWFLKMEKIARPALQAVENNTIKFHPPKFKNLYRHWMENIKDWCISRQLWWGQRIPAYYLPDGKFVVAKTKEEALKKAIEKYNTEELKIDDLKQDEDILDTWFSSWLWPLSVFDGIRNPENKDFKYYYPTDDLVTAPEILFFWVARMIIAGLEYEKKIPFKNVYFTGIVKDKLGRKMSKSLGNSPDPLELIEKFGADGVRLGMLLTSPAGNDLPFDESLCEQGRNFNNKIWNALRLIKSWKSDENIPQSEEAQIAVEWFNESLNQTINIIEYHFNKYRIADGLMLLYRFIWDDFCSWYLELIKPEFGKPIAQKTFLETLEIFEKLMRLLHPYIPFITEEIWHNLQKHSKKETIMFCSYPKATNFEEKTINDFEYIKEIITAIRNIRNKHRVSPKITLNILSNIKSCDFNRKYDSAVRKLTNIGEIDSAETMPDKYISFRVRTSEFYILIASEVNQEDETESIKKELEYYQGFLDSTSKKLSNERFVNNAPKDVVEKEKKKQRDAIEKIKILEEQLKMLKK